MAEAKSPEAEPQETQPSAPLPTREQCIELLRRHGTPSNIIAHSEKVTEVALYLARKLLEKGEKVDLALVESGGLLHDVGRALGSVEVHSDLGYELLLPKWPRLAEVVRNHMLDYILPPNSLEHWEDKVVFYADKRVKSTEIVPLQQRFDYFRKRYGPLGKGIMKLINDSQPLTEALEREIFNIIDADVSLDELKKGG